jgi:hypothetical protein
MTIIRAAFLLVGFAGCALARPVVLEPASTFTNPDSTYPSFAVDVAIDGNFALATAEKPGPPDANGEPAVFDLSTAFLFARSGRQWTLVRRLEERRNLHAFRVDVAVAMQNGIAAVQAGELDFWALVDGTWQPQPAATKAVAPGPYLSVDGGRALVSDGDGSWDAEVFEKDATGTWVTAVRLPGNTRHDGGDDENRGGPADLSADHAVVYQLDNPENRTPEVLIYQHTVLRQNGASLPIGSASGPEGASRFGPEVAIRWPDVFVGGGNESGTYVFRDTGGQGFQIAERIQTPDSFMGAGPAGAFAKSGEFLLQHAWSPDRAVSVINVFRQRDDASYEHVAILAAKNGASLGRSIAISGRSVLVGNNGNGLVHYFELPASLESPVRIQDTFATGNGNGWTPTAGSAFATVAAGGSRVYRQSSVAGLARAILAASDWTTQAIEADVRTAEFAASGSGFGLATRYQNPQNFYDVIVRNTGVVQLRRMAGGAQRVIAQAPFTPVAGRLYRLRLESVGTLHRVLIDGKLLLDADITGPTHGRAALLTDRARADFDNVVVSPALNTIVFANDFESGTPGPWKFTGLGFWNLRTGASTVYDQSSVAGDARASIGAPTDDQIVRVRARLDTFATQNGAQERWFGLMARYVDDRNFYYLSLRSSNTASLRKVVNGTVTVLGSVALPVNPATWYSLRLDAVGNQLRAYVNGRQVLEASDNSLASGASGPVMFKAAVDYDDFSTILP